MVHQVRRHSQLVEPQTHQQTITIGLQSAGGNSHRRSIYTFPNQTGKEPRRNPTAPVPVVTS